MHTQQELFPGFCAELLDLFHSSMTVKAFSFPIKSSREVVKETDEVEIPRDNVTLKVAFFPLLKYEK